MLQGNSLHSLPFVEPNGVVFLFTLLVISEKLDDNINVIVSESKNTAMWIEQRRRGESTD